MGFRNYKAFVDSCENGQEDFASFRKQQSFVTSQAWVDLSMASGSPPANFFASEPLVAATFPASKGIYVGDAVSPRKRYLREWGLASAGIAAPFFLADYLLYYPFIDLTNASRQEMDNTVTLPRYQDGADVEMMLVIQAATNIGTGLTIQYTDHFGVSRTANAYVNNGSLNVGSIPTASPGSSFVTAGPFIRQAAVNPTYGVRSVQAITPGSPVDGLLALVLLRPLANSQTYELNTWHEKNFTARSGSAPQILDGAVLNMIMGPRANVANSILTGYIKTVWN